MGNARVDRDQNFMKNEHGTEELITDYDGVYDRWVQKKEKELKEVDFEEVWKSRSSHLDKASGFLSFLLLKDVTNEEYTLYVSHTAWKSKVDFENGIKSENFRNADAEVGSRKLLYFGHPESEGFEALLGS